MSYKDEALALVNEHFREAVARWDWEKAEKRGLPVKVAAMLAVARAVTAELRTKR